MKKLVKKNKSERIKTIPLEVINSSNSVKVKRILKRLEDRSFLERLYSYSEKYWDDHHSQLWQ
ncbi:MAG TPA: hypothetical protein PLW61_01260 [Caldisericia bacterium]|nr:hypothetical protein [Caldisericia bacterium]HPB33384.1 hypothetical protein [Caldisericia bacterium]HQL66830.1 hypothetical protein [Caldisericia bacterium]HQN48035.1 hypothetical protein [Caldisericia bacterium]HQO99139.1 hypothetical protein [Caldisericia bacterium]